MPGTTLLRIARLLFNEHLLSVVVEPTIADLQREVADAGSDGRKRLRARWRGCCAFWTLTLVAPFASWASPVSAAGAVAFPGALARVAVSSMAIALLAVIGPVAGAWIGAVATVGALFAIGIHIWYDRHPSDIPVPAEPQRSSPQINFSSTEIAGNAGGLIFSVGSVFIVAVGLPSTIWFLFAATIAGCFLAWALAAWHRIQPTYGLPENRITLR